MFRSLVTAALVCAGANVVPTAQGQTTTALPKAAEILDQYVEATGGKAAYEKLTNRVCTGTLDLVGANVKGKITTSQASPNKIVVSTDLGSLGKTRQGTDGQVAWETSTFGGERILEGEEKEAFLMQALFNGEIHWKERLVKAECVAIEKVDGKPAAKLILTRKAGKPSVEFYDLGSHLLVKQIISTKSPMGEITIEQYPGDYRNVDGVLMPCSVKQLMLGQEMVTKFTDIKHNVELPADTFALPKEISKLQSKKVK